MSTAAKKKKNLSSVMQKVLQARQELKDAMYEVADAIVALPKNDKLKPIKGSCLMFVVQRKDLGDVWSPQYMCYQYQYNIIAEEFRRNPLHAIDWWIVKRRLGKIIKYTYDYDPWTGKWLRSVRESDVLLSPEVIKNVDKLLGIGEEEK